MLSIIIIFHTRKYHTLNLMIGIEEAAFLENMGSILTFANDRLKDSGQITVPLWGSVPTCTTGISFTFL